MAVLLAASLRLHFPRHIDLIAAHPTFFGELRPETKRALASLDVVIVPICNPLGADFLIGHKLAALMLIGGPDLGLFLDTDMLAMGAPEPLPNSIAARVAGSNQHTAAVWKYVYESFDLAVPTAGPATVISGETTAPYYNSGMISVPGYLAGRLVATWIETAARIDADPSVPLSSKRPWLDQLSLPIAAARLGLPIELLDPKWNFPAGWRTSDHGMPILLHYRRALRIKEEEVAMTAAAQAADIMPSVREALAAFSFID
jgi:hypothetical protein